MVGQRATRGATVAVTLVPATAAGREQLRGRLVQTLARPLDVSAAVRERWQLPA